MCPIPPDSKGKTAGFYNSKEGRRKRSFPTSVVRGFLLSGLSLILIFVVAEAVTRIVYDPPNLGRVIQFDKDLGWSLKPNSSLRSVDKVRSFDYIIGVNSFGMREREFQRKKNGTRILAIGDSFTFGTSVDSDWR